MIENEFYFWFLSSVGRAPPRQGGGRWFEPSRDHLRNNKQEGRYYNNSAIF